MSLAPARSTSTLGQGICEDSPQLPTTLTIILPDELLLEIFDAYRQHFRDNDHWNRRVAWFKLTHVCRRWRRVVFASFCRLDLCLVLTTLHVGHMKTILSPRLPPLPITIDYSQSRPTSKDTSRLSSALKHHDRVRGISLKGMDRDFTKFFKDAKCPCPILESLELYSHHGTLSFPAKFLGGSTPLLQRLQVDPVQFASISRILSSATSLVELSLGLDTTFGPSPEVSLLAYIQAMPCLRNLELTISRRSIDGLVHTANPKYIVTLSYLTRFYYSGCSAALNALVSGLNTPSLRDLCIGLVNEITSPSHLPRFIDDLDKEYHSVQLAFGTIDFRVSLLTDSEHIDCRQPRFKFCSRHSQDSLMRLSSALSAKFIAAKELLITFEIRGDDRWQDITSWRKFLWPFRSVKVIRLERSGILDIADCLVPASPDFLPSLEEIELRAHDRTVRRTPESEFEAELAAFQPFVLAREQAGRPIKVYRSITNGVEWGFPQVFG